MKIKNINDFLNSIYMILVSGLCLIASLLIHLGVITDSFFGIDPGYFTIIISGTPMLLSAVNNLVRNKKISSSLLITIAIFACIYIGEEFAAAEIAFIMAIGGWLEDRTIEKTKKGINQLLSIAPNTAKKVQTTDNGDEIIEVSVNSIKIGDIVRVFPGDSVPVDGEIIKGNTTIDQAIMTGESLPVDKWEGDEVFSGTINRFGSIDVKVKKVFEDSVLQKMIKLVNDAENNKAPTQRIVDRWASWIVPTAVVLAISTYIFTGDITRSVTILVVFCPCALTLATPTSIVAAVGQASNNGVLIKSGYALEMMGKVDVVGFDKTGTITLGKLDVTDIVGFNNSNDEILVFVSSIEAHSEHPIAKAITKYASENKIRINQVQDFQVRVGMGVMGNIESTSYYCGNEKLLREYNIPMSIEVEDNIRDLRNQGKAVVIVANSKQILGLIALSDTVKKESRNAINSLYRSGVKKAVLLTGDNELSANYIANKVQIKEVFSSLFPEDKANKIKNFRDEGSTVAMIGDGVNDALALKYADVGIAMGSVGSDIAIEAADIALMGDDIGKISYLKTLSNATINNIKFNITLAMLINFIAVILSVGGFMGPIGGALFHNAGSILVVFNAIFLYERKF